MSSTLGFLLRYRFFLLSLLFLPALVTLGQESPQPKPGQDPLQDSIQKYTKRGNDALALTFAEKYSAKMLKQKGGESEEYATSLTAWGNSLNAVGKYAEAETLLTKAVDINRNLVNKHILNLVSSLSALGSIFSQKGDYTKAESIFLQALEYQKKAAGPGTLQTGSLLQNLGGIYYSLGNFSQAETHLLEALEIYMKSGVAPPNTQANLFQDLGNLYLQKGNYPKSENYYRQGLDIYIREHGEMHPSVANCYENIAILCYYMGKVAAMEPYFLKSLEIRKKILNDDHPDMASSYNNLGSLYYELGNYPKSEHYQLKSLELHRKLYGDDHKYVAGSIHNLGNLYSGMGRLSKAEKMYRKAMEIEEKLPDVNNPGRANTWASLASILNEMGRLSEAEELYTRALNLRISVQGRDNPHTVQLLGALGKFQFLFGRMEKSEGLFTSWKNQKDELIRRNFPFLSDQEKEEFYKGNFFDPHDSFKSFCVQRNKANRSISAELYNDQLSSKGLLLNSSAKWKHRIKTSGDLKLLGLYTDWEAAQKKLSRLWQSTDSTERAGLDSLVAKTEKMEKELSLRSENFARLADKKLFTWKDVQKALKPGEAAVEIIRVRKPGVVRTVTDTSDPRRPTYQIRGLTDTVRYVALIVKPESQYPEMVVLENGNELEGRHLRFYQNAIRRHQPDHQSYGHFWEPIGSRLAGIERVYFSPDGVFHRISLQTLFNSRTRKYLLEEKDIRLVTVTRDIVNPPPVEQDNRLAVLLGSPNFYPKQSAPEVAVAERKSPRLTYGLQLDSGLVLEELPATETEVERTAELLQSRGWEVKNYLGSLAHEGNVKESYKPRVLHLATHGMFQPDSLNRSNPLIRSGLLLAGAGNTLKGLGSGEGEDGILTAYEAMNLNLDNTDLVVLSACETGLGEIKNGEGVYGLQRAFKVAGARSIIMSLWKVDDEATQELMVRFYKNWLGTDGSRTVGQTASRLAKGADGNGKRAAFLKAQKELKAKYPNPYYWGAFVMVGE